MAQNNILGKKMIDSIIRKVSESEIDKANLYYWRYQFRLGMEYLVPYMQSAGCFNSGANICEIGSAEGGALHSFILNGADYGLGTDIAESRIIAGQDISKILELNVDYSLHNILDEEPHDTWIKHFDIVLLRDVIEHLDDTFLALHNIRKIIKTNGFLLVTFPPYYSPYGGHQHTLAGNFLTKLPYIHLLPNFIFHNIIKSGRENDQGEVKRLQNIKLTSAKLKKAAKQAGYDVFVEDYYLIRPVFKMKFGLNPLRITPISKLPFVKDLFALECTFILRAK